MIIGSCGQDCDHSCLYLDKGGLQERWGNLSGNEVTGHNVMVSNYKEVFLDYIERRNSSLWGWWGTGTGFPEKL